MLGDGSGSVDYETLKQSIDGYANRELNQRKTWYSPAAEAYNQVRPRYPEALVRQVIEVAQLSEKSRLLEVGCGPGTATVTFAELGLSLLSLEPNPDFYRLAQQNCEPYTQVEIQNTSFEEWPIESGQFDAVLAATSFHWIPAEVGYPKAAEALKDDGQLILLWNKELQPAYEVYQSLSEMYQAYAPALDRYEDKETQTNILQGLGQLVLESGCFKNLVTGQVETKVTYSTDQYLTLLNTYSGYLKLELQRKEALFEGLRNRIDNDFDGKLDLTYISAFHIAQKC